MVGPNETHAFNSQIYPAGLALTIDPAGNLQSAASLASSFEVAGHHPLMERMRSCQAAE